MRSTQWLLLADHRWQSGARSKTALLGGRLEFVDPEQDYSLSSSQIPPEMRSEFVVDQISVAINP